MDLTGTMVSRDMRWAGFNAFMIFRAGIRETCKKSNKKGYKVIIDFYTKGENIS